VAPVRGAVGVGVGVLAGDLDEELFADRAEEPLDLPAALRATRRGVDQPDAEFGAGPQQPGVDERGAYLKLFRGCLRCLARVLRRA
jgi:hypothetical protein